MTCPPPPSDPHGGSPGYGSAPTAPRADPLISYDYSEWWSRGLRIGAAAWKPLLAIQLLAAAAMLALVGALAVAVSRGDRDAGGVSAVADELLDAVANRLAPDDSLWAAVAVTLAGLVFAMATLAAVPVVVARASGQPVDAATVRRTALRRALPLFGWQLVASVLIVIGVLLCLLPGIYAMLALTPLPAVVAFERGQVLGRCFRLFNNALGPALARTATVVVIPWILLGVLALIAERVTTSIDGGDGVTASLVGGGAAAGRPGGAVGVHRAAARRHLRRPAAPARSGRHLHRRLGERPGRCLMKRASVAASASRASM